jgi:hypothetical protein
MRAALLASILVFTASAAVARPFAATMPDDPAIHLTLPSQERVAADLAGRWSPDTALIGSRASAAPAVRTGFFIEPLPVETTDDPRTGRRHRVLQYRLDGVSVLGGSVGGSLGKPGAMLSLRWPSRQ